MPDDPAGEGPEELWSAVLDAVENHLGEVRGGLSTGVMPEPYQVSLPKAPLPPTLAPRARQVLAIHHDVQNELRDRLATMACVLAGWRATPAPGPVYVDRRN